jgi:GxxExxY protein
LRGGFFEVYNTLGFGHKEIAYQNALAEEFEPKGIDYEKEKVIPIKYGKKKVATYRPDFVIDHRVIIEVKALEYLPKKLTTQLVYYLKGTDYKLGFLVNFGAQDLQIIRRIWTPVYVSKNRS